MTLHDLAGLFQNQGSHLSVSCQGRCVEYLVTVNVDLVPTLRVISATFLYWNASFPCIINDFFSRGRCFDVVQLSCLLSNFVFQVWCPSVGAAMAVRPVLLAWQWFDFHCLCIYQLGFFHKERLLLLCMSKPFSQFAISVNSPTNCNLITDIASYSNCSSANHLKHFKGGYSAFFPTPHLVLRASFWHNSAILDLRSYSLSPRTNQCHSKIKLPL